MTNKVHKTPDSGSSDYHIRRILANMDGYCPNCQGLIQKLQETGPLNAHYDEPCFNSVVGLEKGYTEGCTMCRLFVQSLNNENLNANSMEFLKRHSGASTYFLSTTLRYCSWDPDCVALSLRLKQGPGVFGPSCELGCHKKPDKRTVLRHFCKTKANYLIRIFQLG